MTPKKSTQTAPKTPATPDPLQTVTELDGITDALNAATGNTESPDSGTVDFGALAAKVATATESIKAEESKVGSARVAQVADVATVVDSYQTVWNIWQKKTTTETTKAEIRKHFPIVPDAKSQTDAIYTELANAGLALTTAKNLIVLAKAKNQNLVTYVQAGCFSISVAYDLGRAEMTDADLEAASKAGLVVSNVTAWLDSRNAAKTIKAQYPTYRVATDNAAKYAAQAKAQPAGTAGAVQARELTDKADIQRAEANTAWNAITAARDVILSSLFPHALRELDADTFTVVEAEIQKRAEAETTQVVQANEDAQAKARKLKADASAKMKAANEAETRRQVANETAKTLQAEIADIQRKMDKAEADAVEELRTQLADLTRLAAKANEDAEATRKEADIARKEAEQTNAKALIAERAAKAQAEKTAKATGQTAATVTRPKASTFDGLLAAYRAMPAQDLRDQMTDIATALWKRGTAYTADWLAYGAALDAELIDPTKPKAV